MRPRREPALGSHLSIWPFPEVLAAIFCENIFTLYTKRVFSEMSEKERRERARVATRRWKERNPFLVKKQYERRRERIRAALALMRGTGQMTRTVINDNPAGDNRSPHGYIGKDVQETSHVPIDDAEGDPEVMRRHREQMMARGRVPGQMEPEQRGGHESEGRVEEHAGVDQNSGGVGGMGDRGGGEVGDIAESGGGVEGGLAGGADEAAGLTDEARRLRFQQLKRDLGVVRSQIQVEEEVEVPW
jgi:hypothetical protein